MSDDTPKDPASGGEPAKVVGGGKAIELDARQLAPAQRLLIILETCTHLPTGDAVVLVNDSDPKPLYYRLEAEFPGQFSWHYLQPGPELWKVQITRR